MSKYEITKFRSMTNEVRYAIYSREERGFYAGYDFMGSVNWKQIKVPDEECELTAEDDPWQIVKDLESADAPAEPDSDAGGETNALLIVLQAAVDHLDHLNSHGYVDRKLENAINELAKAID